MAEFKFRREVSYSEFYKVEAETKEEALKILETCDAGELYETYADGESDSLVGGFDLDEEDA
jgi:hypothetical protein